MNETARHWAQRFARIVGAAAGAMLLAVAVAGCPAEQSDRCRALCHDLVMCIASEGHTGAIIDEHECTSTCTALERDPEGAERVDRYGECVNKNASCDWRLACSKVVTPDHPVDPTGLD